VPTEDTTPRRLWRQAKRVGRWFIDRPTLSVLLVVGLSTAAGFALFVSRENDRAKDEHTLDAKIVEAARGACYRANHTRDGVRALITKSIRDTQKQIYQAKHTDYSELFPEAAQSGKLDKLIAKNLHQLMTSLHDPEHGLFVLRRKVHNAPCNKLYPKVPTT